MYKLTASTAGWWTVSGDYRYMYMNLGVNHSKAGTKPRGRTFKGGGGGGGGGGEQGAFIQGRKQSSIQTYGS